MVILASAGARETPAATVQRDFLAGIGDFETSGVTEWEAATTPLWTYGVQIPTADDAVGSGWRRVTDYGVVSGANTVFRIQPGTGLSGSRGQHFAVKDLNAGAKWVDLQSKVPVNDSKPSCPHHGDQVTFAIDQIAMSSYIGAPVAYKLKIGFGWADGQSTWQAPKLLMPSPVPSRQSISATVPPGAIRVQVCIEIAVSGALGASEPGANIDGAHLYCRRSGSPDYETETVPVERDRAINTVAIFFDPTIYDIRQTARDYDEVVFSNDEHHASALVMRYYNPSVKVYLYQAVFATCEWRDPVTKKDPFYMNGPFGTEWLLNNPDPSHSYASRWLYPPNGDPPGGDPRPQSLREAYAYCLLPTTVYPLRYVDSELFRVFRERSIEKVTRYGMQGVFFDGPTEATCGIVRPANECQSFAHSVFPYARKAGLTAIHNLCGYHINSGFGAILFDRWWKPDGSHPAPPYEANTPELTADVFFQEWSFFGIDSATNTNKYDTSYWEATLTDMETIALWNKDLPAHLRKRMHAFAVGVDTTQDPAISGLDGWAHFSLCSYLLAQNQFTAFGVMRAVSLRRVDMDWSVTTRLGSPLAPRQRLNQKGDLQSRDYANGVVVVNGSTTDDRTYAPAFDAVDQAGTQYHQGVPVTLGPHTGRLLLKAGY